MLHWAAAPVVKDGQFVDMKDGAGLSACEGEFTDLGGRHIMSHVHVSTGAGYEGMDFRYFILTALHGRIHPKAIPHDTAAHQAAAFPQVI